MQESNRLLSQESIQNTNIICSEQCRIFGCKPGGTYSNPRALNG